MGPRVMQHDNAVLQCVFMRICAAVNRWPMVYSVICFSKSHGLTGEFYCRLFKQFSHCNLLAKTKHAWHSLSKERMTTSLRFSAAAPTDLLNADVTFATADAFSRIPPICQHIFITCAVTNQKLHMITSWMPKGSTVILYNSKP